MALKIEYELIRAKNKLTEAYLVNTIKQKCPTLWSKYLRKNK